MLLNYDGSVTALSVIAISKRRLSLILRQKSRSKEVSNSEKTFKTSASASIGIDGPAISKSH